MIKRFHEAPKSIFKQVQALTDGDYALVHLFEEDLEYYNLFEDAVKSGREVILDNSIFELGEAFNLDRFAIWIERLKPQYYVIPDVLDKGPETAERLVQFCATYGDLPGLRIGVVQGRNYDEFRECYKVIEPYVDKVGISFDCAWYQDLVQSDDRWYNMAQGRKRVLMQLDNDGVINHAKPHHLLGVALPQEVSMYTACSWIESVDTSNPVVHGLKNIRYSQDGLPFKETQKLYTLINSEVTQEQWQVIEYNIRTFRGFCNE